ncbi:MAG: hypothetical protein JNN08_14215 [Bryobacterales bacterium]|nr:hypothetical protein [Bryobacterales bacterium]
MRIVPGLIALALACAAAPCWAQSTIAKIPFDFTVNNLTLPAGEYSIEEAMEGIQAVRSTRGDFLTAFALAYPTVVNRAGLAQLVFRKYGDKYFLAEFWTPLNGDVIAFRKCRKERELVISRVVSGLRVDRVAVLARVR